MPKVIIEFEVADSNIATVIEKTVGASMRQMVENNPMIQNLNTRIEP